MEIKEDELREGVDIDKIFEKYSIENDKIVLYCSRTHSPEGAITTYFYSMKNDEELDNFLKNQIEILKDYDEGMVLRIESLYIELIMLLGSEDTQTIKIYGVKNYKNINTLTTLLNK